MPFVVWRVKLQKKCGSVHLKYFLFAFYPQKSFNLWKICHRHTIFETMRNPPSCNLPLLLRHYFEHRYLLLLSFSDDLWGKLLIIRER